MWAYQCQLAWHSMRKTPALCGLVMLALAFGVAAAMVTYTSQHLMVSNSLAHKNERLALVQTDAWHAREAFQGMPLNQMSDLLSYRDVQALANSTIPRYSVPMAQWGGTLNLPDMSVKSSMVFARLTSAGFFSLFEASFAYGAPWSPAVDQQFRPEVVITDEINRRLFNGGNSVGRELLLEGRTYQVVGVLKPWHHNGVRMDNLAFGAFVPPPQVFLPWSLIQHQETQPWSSRDCPEDFTDYGTGQQALLTGSCQWLSLWVEFHKAEDKAAYGDFVASYINSQKALGRYPRPLRYALSDPDEKIHINRQDRSIFFVNSLIGQALLLICIVNAIALLLAKFIRLAPEIGVRRALGASRQHIFIQHLLESAALGIGGGLAGLGLTYIGLKLLKKSFIFMPTKGLSVPAIDAVFVLDTQMLGFTLVVGLIASVLAGLYPAWRICRSPIAPYLKTQ